jgi:DNA repair protein RecO (recombination protein O)
MDWSDTGLILAARKHGETSVILEAMTQAHGRHLGVVRGGRSRAMQVALQPGNRVSLAWRARLEDHLGVFSVEPDALRAGRLIGSAMALHGLQWMGALLRLLPERDPHEGVYHMADALAERLDDSALAPELFVRFELAVLGELGFGLDLEECAATGARDELIYVSPKSGRAVGRAAGAPWAERLLTLPGFLHADVDKGQVAKGDLLAGFRLTGHFLERDLFSPRGLAAPDCRQAFIAACCV